MLCVDSLWHLNQSQEAAGAHTLVSPVAVSPRADLRETQELKSQVLCMRLKYVEMGVSENRGNGKPNKMDDDDDNHDHEHDHGDDDDEEGS